MIKIRHMSKKIDIVSSYLDDYSDSFSGREIGRLINANHQTALNHINNLLNEKILKAVNKGKNKEYSLELKNLKTRILLEIAEHYKSLKSLANKELKILVTELLPHCESIIIFGSFAKGIFDKNSDIDIIIVGSCNKDAVRSIKRRYSREISIEFVTYAQLRHSLKTKNALGIEILNNHIIYGNVSKIIMIFMEWYLR